MAIKTKLVLLILLVVIAIYLTRCNGNFISIWRADRRHEFTIRQTHLHISIDAPVMVEITGELDGKAVVFIPNGPQDSTGIPVWRDNYSVRLPKGKIDKKIYTEMDGDFPLVYQPITAKNGSLSIKVNY